LPSTLQNYALKLTWSISMDGTNWVQFAQSTHTLFVLVGEPSAFNGVTITPFSGGAPQTYEAAPTITAARVNFSLQQPSVTGNQQPAIVATTVANDVIPKTFHFNGNNNFAASQLANPWVALANPSIKRGGWDCISLTEATVVQLLALGLQPGASQQPAVLVAYAIYAPYTDATQPRLQGSGNNLEVLAFFPEGTVSTSNVNLFESYFTLLDPNQGLEAFMVVPPAGPIIAATDPYANNSYVSGAQASMRLAFAVKAYEIQAENSVQGWWYPNLQQLGQSPVAFPIPIQ
jgi:hypothetical protein